MRHVTLWAVLVVWIATLGRGPAWADTRPRVAVLGLEVTNNVDVRMTDLAHDLTEGMRARARLGTGPYAYAPGSERELIDEKLINACDNEAPACMSQIGKSVDADVLVYGKLEKEDKVVRLTLHLLDVTKKAKLNRTSTTVPIGSTKDQVRAAARKAYDELAGAAAGTGAGSVEIAANVTTGTVYIDDSTSEPLVDGKASLTLPEGRYRIAVESPGKQRKEITVTVTAEQVVTQRFDLIAVGAGGGTRSFDAWKPAFAVSLAAFVGVFTYQGYLWFKWRGDADAIMASKPEPGPISDADCDGSGLKADVTDLNGVLTSVCETKAKQKTWAIVSAVLVVPVVATGYMAFVRRKGDEPKRVAVTPVITPSSAGAMVELHW